MSLVVLLNSVYVVILSTVSENNVKAFMRSTLIMLQTTELFLIMGFYGFYVQLGMSTYSRISQVLPDDDSIVLALILIFLIPCIVCLLVLVNGTAAIGMHGGLMSDIAVQEQGDDDDAIRSRVKANIESFSAVDDIVSFYHGTLVESSSPDPAPGSPSTFLRRVGVESRTAKFKQQLTMS